jgi:ribose/xylose/arabinose/galactoside ABC-type transport system permease subunit
MTAGKSPIWRLGNLLLHHPMEIILAMMILVLTLSAPGFATLGNLLSVLRTISMLGIIAFGMTAVIIAGEIDLSIGSGVALAGCIVAWFAGALTNGLGPLAAVIIGAAAAIAVGVFLGYATGLVRHWFNVPTFITTLGLLAGLRGTANLITGGFPLTTFPGWFDFFGGGYLFFVPFPVYIFAATFLCMFFLMNYTRFGRAVYAVGGNMEAARLSGIDIWAVKSTTLAITGGLTAVSGILIASLIGSGTGTTATGMELDVIAATIIGGTSLFGGKGRIGGTLIGVLFLGVISNGMTLLDVNEYWQYVARGAIILGAVLINQVLERAR